MIKIRPWMKREFCFDQPIDVFPALLERLRGTPVRAGELVAGVSDDVLAKRPNGKWSAKDHLGHLVDLQPLDEQRLHEFLARTPALSAADISNRATEQGNHRQTPVAHILGRLRIGREKLVAELDALTAEEIAISAAHPRLQKPMRVLDWVYFVAEHDDHHLAKARRAILSGDKRWSGDREERSQ
jgi:hypothetical protein